MNNIPIVFCFDENLVMPAVVSITSLLENAFSNTFYDIYIIHSNKYDFTQTPLRSLSTIYTQCNITFCPILDDIFKDAFEIRGITTPAYYRLLIPELIYKYDKILYSDVDVIFRDDLSVFYNIDLGNNYLGAVDVGVALRADIRKYVQTVLHLNVANGYYYSGNLVINSKMLRENGIVEQFKRLILNNYHYQDMDIINIACNGKIKSLSPAFCLTNYLLALILYKNKDFQKFFSKEELDYALTKGIIHYNGMKPWNGNCHNQDVWWYYYRKSIIYDDTYIYQFYNNRINENENWSLSKRVKHVLRYFRKK